MIEMLRKRSSGSHTFASLVLVLSCLIHKTLQNVDTIPLLVATTESLQPTAPKLSTLPPPTTVKNSTNIQIVNLPVEEHVPKKLVNKPQQGKRGIADKRPFLVNIDVDWKCPNISRNQNVECGCDMPHTLRCSGNLHGLELIANGLRNSPYSVSLLDCTLKNVSFLSDARIFENISLHGLVISSGEIKRVHRAAFVGLKLPLQALGLPNNALMSVPWNALSPLTSLDRLDLSNNRIKALGVADFATLRNLTYLELSENQISSIPMRTFAPLTRLITLKLNGNRIGDFATNFLSIGQCLNLRELDLQANSIRGILMQQTLPDLPKLENLNLDRNILTSVQNGAMQGFPRLVTLSLRHNQIDVLQDHAFAGLSSLQVLDLGYNGIVAVSGASLQHLPRLLELDLTHNFLRALTSDLIAPLPSLRELRLDGNDISIVSRNALDGAHEIRSLSLQDNPLSCDCTLRSFSEWLLQSKVPSQDLLGAVCATPPHLEGAPLLQIPAESFKCDGNDYSVQDLDNSNVLEQLDGISKEGANHGVTNVVDAGDVITLKDVKYTRNRELVFWWNIFMRSSDYACDSLYVYREENVHEILLDDSAITCESDIDTAAKVVLTDITPLQFGESYRFCLAIIQSRTLNLIVGCSNITKLESAHQQFTYRKINSPAATNFSDIVAMEKMASTFHDNIDDDNDVEAIIQQPNFTEILSEDHKNRIEIFNNFTASKNIIPGLGLCIILMSLFVLVWFVTRFKNERRPTRTPVTTLYTAANVCGSSDNIVTGRGGGIMGHPLDIESRSRYVKLQATTSL